MGPTNHLANTTTMTRDAASSYALDANDVINEILHDSNQD